LTLRPGRAAAAFAFAWVTAAAASLPACSSVYRPRPSARVGLIIQHGGAFYVKDGQAYPIGPLGGPLEALVASSPPAVLLAQRSRSQLAVGAPLYVAGVTAVVVGLLASPSPAALKWGLVVGGAGAGVTGIGLMGAGVTNAVDAVNVYNDTVGTEAPIAHPAP
jgi:hypothetical protein